MQEYRWNKEKSCWMVGELTEYQYRAKLLVEYAQHAKEHPEQHHCYLCKKPLEAGDFRYAYGYQSPLCQQCWMAVD